MRRIVFLFLCVISTWTTFGAAPEDQFQKGVEAYEAGKYQAAIDEWKSLDESGMKSCDLYYNLGNGYFKKGEFPTAILYYEKALLEKPFDKEVKHNLALANERIVKQIKPLPDFFLKRGWTNSSNIFSANTWSWLALVFFWIGIGLVITRLFDWKKGRLQGHYLLGGGLVVMSLLFLLLGFSRGRLEQDSRMAIVLKSNIELRTAPESTVDIMELPEGTKLDIIDKIGVWEKVEAPNGEVGWIHEEDAVRI